MPAQSVYPEGLELTFSLKSKAFTNPSLKQQLACISEEKGLGEGRGGITRTSPHPSCWWLGMQVRAVKTDGVLKWGEP